MRRKSQVNQAIAEGLHYTGISNSDKEIVKERIKKERAEKKGMRIILVSEKCRGRIYDTIMYSAYADNKYFAYDTVERLKNYEANHDAALERIENEYVAKVMEAKEKLEKDIIEYNKAVSIIKGE